MHEEETRQEDLLTRALVDPRRKVKGAIAELSLAVVSLRRLLDTLDSLMKK